MSDIHLPLSQKRVAFSGKLGGVSKREADRLVKNCGGVPVPLSSDEIDLVVLGADELPMAHQQELLDDRLRGWVRRGKLEVIDESQFWIRLGFNGNRTETDEDHGDHNDTSTFTSQKEKSGSDIQRLYTPAMVAELIKVTVADVRKWFRHGLIKPCKKIHRLPYFDFQEISTARRLAELVEGGVSPTMIRRRLEEISEYLPQFERPLAQLSIIVEGKNFLLRQDNGIVEPNGQIRLDFSAPTDSSLDDTDSLDEESVEEESNFDDRMSIAFPTNDTPEPEPDLSKWSREELVDLACTYEDEGKLDESIEIYRTALFAHGVNAEINFQLAELLYRIGQLEAARERYYSTIELDEEFVEARANLGCVLTELGQDELAVAAFLGAIELHAHFPDVHFHLARTLDRLKRTEEAEIHWREFLKMSPDNSWAAEARERLRIETVSP